MAEVGDDGITVEFFFSVGKYRIGETKINKSNYNEQYAETRTEVKWEILKNPLAFRMQTDSMERNQIGQILTEIENLNA